MIRKLLETVRTAATLPGNPLQLAADAAALDEWCIVELLGHRRLAARVREVTLAGAGMLRLDEPATEGKAARTSYVSASSVYALHPTTEQVVLMLSASWATPPVSRYELERAAALDAEDLTDRNAW